MEEESQWHEWVRVFDTENVARLVAKLTERDEVSEEWPENDVKSAAVLVPLVTVDKVPSVLFTLRSRELSHHRNQVSFPGGLADTTDTTPVATALRETEEELGISPEDVHILGKLRSFPGRNLSSMITPVIGHIREIEMNKLKINQSEVVEAFTLPLHHLADQRHHRYTEFRLKPGLPSPSYKTPVFLGGRRRIWGFTAFILDMVLMHLIPKDFKYVPIVARTLNSTVARRFVKMK